MKVGLDGVEFLGASASEWINGGIRILPGDKGEMKASYPLYANLEKALENSLSDLPTTTVSLSAETLPDVQAGSVVLYRKFEVGEVITVRPRANAFDIDLHIKPEYRNLLTSNSVFWAEGGAKVQLNGSGLTVQASPLSRALKGAISFDNLSGASASQRKGDKRILYASETAARAVGGQITLHAFDAGKLAVGMPIRYLGIDIGQIQTLDLITARNEVQAKAVLYPEYVQTFARGGTRFSVVTPQISAAGVEHLDTILQPYINVEPVGVILAVTLSCKKLLLLIRVTGWLKHYCRSTGSRFVRYWYACAVPWSGSRYGYRNDAGDIVRSRDDCDAHQ